MSDLVIVIAGKSKKSAHPVPNRCQRVGVMSSNDKYNRVDRNQCVAQVAESESVVGQEQDRRHNQDGCNFQEPGEVIIGVYGRPEEENRDNPNQDAVVGFVVHK